MHVRHVHHLRPDGGLQHGDQGEDDERKGGEESLDKPCSSHGPAQSPVILALQLPVDEEEVNTDGGGGEQEETCRAVAQSPLGQRVEDSEDREQEAGQQ